VIYLAIVFIDLDGTLLFQGKPAPKALEALALLKQNGHIPIIATGRVPYLVKDIKEELGIDSYFCASGNYIVYQNELIFEKSVPLESTKKLFEYADRFEFDIVMEGTYDYLAYRKETSVVDEFSDFFQVQRPLVDKTYHLTHSILAFNIFDQKIVPLLETAFPEFVFNRANHLGFDINLKGDLKADGMRFMVNFLQIPKDEVYAIGDGYNDYLMIRDATIGIAMGNAYDEVKKVAKYVTSDVHSGGVYDALKHYHLI
jgi:hypothetical protein